MPLLELLIHRGAATSGDLTYGSSADLVPASPESVDQIVGLPIAKVVSCGVKSGEETELRHRMRSHLLPHGQVSFRRKENARLGNTVAPRAFTEWGVGILQ
jgi:hypothetical protein